MNDTHTIFGAGQIGTLLARELAERGHSVRLVRRSPAGSPIDGVTWMQGDATDRAFVDEACRGATTVYNCTNPPDYAAWDGVLQPLYRSIWNAAGRAEARLVQLDNLYMYGRPEHTPFDETTPVRPCSEKGKLRAELAEQLQQAQERGDVQAAVGRASDFFGPGTHNAAVFRPDVYKRIAGGKTVYTFVPTEQPHSYSFTPDVAHGLAVLGTHEAAVGRVWHLPVAAQLTTAALIERFALRAGTHVKTRTVPGWVMRTASVVSSLVDALLEMQYQWEIPYLVDDGAFRRTFGIAPTELDRAIDDTLAVHRAGQEAA